MTPTHKRGHHVSDVSVHSSQDLLSDFKQNLCSGIQISQNRGCISVKARTQILKRRYSSQDHAPSRRSVRSVRSALGSKRLLLQRDRGRLYWDG